MADTFEPFLSAASNTTSSITAPILEELGNEIDLETCRLLGPFALAIQGIMGAAVFGSLVVKRMRETPRRRWKIWLADVSKQIIGQAFVHMSNVAISDLIASHTSDNPCSLYALNIITDTTLGVLIVWGFLRLSTHLMRTYVQPMYETGYYGSPFSVSLWAEQAAIYVACLTAMKIVVLILFWLFPFLEDVMSWTLSWITNNEAQVFVVMLVIPLIMNLFQFLMIDSFLKSKESHSPMIGADTDEEALRQGFLDGDDDEEADESFDDRHAQSKGMQAMRPKEEEQHTDGAARGALYSIGEEDDDEDDDKYRKKERRRAPAGHAVDLLQSDSGTGEHATGGIEMRTLQEFPSRSSAPPSAAGLPPYTPRADGAETGGDDDWDGAWSGSETTVSRPASPAPAATPAAGASQTAPRSSPPLPPSTLPRGATAIAETAAGLPIVQTGADDDWGFGEETQDAGSADVLFDASTSDDLTHPSPPPAAVPSIPVAREPADIAEPEADEWGLDLDDSASVNSAASPKPIQAASALSDAVLPAAEPANAAVETPTFEEDDWGFQEEAPQDESALPAAKAEVAASPTDRATSVRSSPREQAANPPEAPASAKDAPAAGGADEDLDDWGFHDSPSLTQVVDGISELRDRVDRLASTRGAGGEQDLI